MVWGERLGIQTLNTLIENRVLMGGTDDHLIQIQHTLFIQRLRQESESLLATFNIKLRTTFTTPATNIFLRLATFSQSSPSIV